MRKRMLPSMQSPDARPPRRGGRHRWATVRRCTLPFLPLGGSEACMPLSEFTRVARERCWTRRLQFLPRHLLPAKPEEASSWRNCGYSRPEEQQQQTTTTTTTATDNSSGNSSGFPGPSRAQETTQFRRSRALRVPTYRSDWAPGAQSQGCARPGNNNSNNSNNSNKQQQQRDQQGSRLRKPAEEAGC